MENKVYKIGDIELTQEKLTIGQALRIKKILSEIGVTAKMDFITVLEMLVDNKRFDEFVKIFLQGNVPVDVSLAEFIPAETGLEIVSDFFLFNDTFIKGLMIFLKNIEKPNQRKKRS